MGIWHVVTTLEERACPAYYQMHKVSDAVAEDDGRTSVTSAEAMISPEVIEAELHFKTMLDEQPAYQHRQIAILKEIRERAGAQRTVWRISQETTAHCCFIAADRVRRTVLGR